MRTRTAVAVLLAGCVGCAAARPAPPALEPLRGEAEVRVYLLPLPRDAERLSFAVDAVTLRHEGGEVPLRPSPRERVAAELRDQRLVAAGRVPAGVCQGLSLHVGSATLGAGAGAARLLVDEDPARVDLGFRLAPGASVVVWVGLEPGAVRDGHAFAPRFSATLPPRTPPRAALYGTDPAAATVTVVDLRARRVSGAVPVGSGPRGVALDATASRAYVALSGEDQIEVVDVAAGASVGRIRLAPGDGPGDLGLGADRTLVVVNDRSRTVAFVDVAAMMEVGRVPIGDGPGALLVDRSGRRAYVSSRGAATVTVLDVPKRAVLGTIATEPEPLRAQLSRAGDRLYVVHRGSAHLAAFAVPSLAPVARAYVGLGAATLRVDARTDLLYLGRSDEGRVDVYEPAALQRLDRFELPAPASHLAIDDAEDAILALVPERGTIAVVDLTSRKVLAELPVGTDPYTFAFPGERP